MLSTRDDANTRTFEKSYRSYIEKMNDINPNRESLMLSRKLKNIPNDRGSLHRVKVSLYSDNSIVVHL